MLKSKRRRRRKKDTPGTWVVTGSRGQIMALKKNRKTSIKKIHLFLHIPSNWVKIVWDTEVLENLGHTKKCTNACRIGGVVRQTTDRRQTERRQVFLDRLRI